MFKLNIKDMLWLIFIIIAVMGVMFGLEYLGFDLSAPINISDGDENLSMSLIGVMSGTIG